MSLDKFGLDVQKGDLLVDLNESSAAQSVVRALGQPFRRTSSFPFMFSTGLYVKVEKYYPQVNTPSQRTEFDFSLESDPKGRKKKLRRIDLIAIFNPITQTRP